MFKIIKRRTSRFNCYYGKTNFSKQNYYRQLFFLLLFTVGLVAGSLAVKNELGDLLTKLLSVYENYIGVKAGERPLINFANSFLKSVATLIILYSAGLCAVGTPIIYSAPVISGIGTGTISAYLYRTFSLKGIGYCALTVYPGKIITTVIMITACTYSTVMSAKMLKTLTIGDEDLNFKQYNIKYLILLLFSVLSSLADTVLNSLFAGYFSFR